MMSPYSGEVVTARYQPRRLCICIPEHDNDCSSIYRPRGGEGTARDGEVPACVSGFGNGAVTVRQTSCSAPSLARTSIWKVDRYATACTHFCCSCFDLINVFLMVATRT